jgi:hypothetical protein
MDLRKQQGVAMKKGLACLGLLAVLAQGAWGWRPSGWVYHDYPWAYDAGTGDWHWFGADAQWVVEMDGGQWAKLENSALASGWAYYDWAFAYAQGNGAWHWINEPDEPWTVNMRTGEWSRFGEGRRRLEWADVMAGFAGTFAVPMAAAGDDRFGYSSGVHAQLGNGNLLVTGHPYYGSQAEVQLPGTLDGSEGTRVGGWIDVTGGRVPAGWTGGLGDGALLVGGLLEADGRIYFTKYEGYNGAGTDWQTQGFNEGGVASGLWGVDGAHAHHSRVGGYLGTAPQALRAEGFAYLAGLEGTSGAALGRWGPNLFAIDPAVVGGKVGSAALLCHPDEARQGPSVRASNATSEWWAANGAANEGWWVANKVTDARWIETDRVHGVLCFVYRGLGNRWYGLSDAGPGLPDPYGGGSGYHAEGWALEAWVYDADEAMAVYRGQREPWSLSPAEVVLLIERLPGAATETHYGVFTGRAQIEVKASERDGRLIVLQENGHPADEWENTPKGYVFNLP